MSDPTKIHVHTSDDGPCGYCSGVDCPMRYCPGCPPGCALAEDEPDSTSDVRSVSPARGPECPESVAGDGPGVTQSPSGYPSDPPPLKGPQNRVERVSDAEAAEWARLAEWATEGPWVVDSDGSIGAPMAGFACGEDGHPRLDCSECGTRVCHVNVMPGEPDAAFIAAARTAVPRLLVEREALRADHAALLALHEVEFARRESAEARATRLTADLDAMEAEDSREDVRAKHWTEVLRVRRELDGIRREMNDVTEIIAEALGYRPSGLPLDGWPHLSTTGDHTPTSLAAEAAGVLAKASRLRAGIEALAAEMQSDTCPACHAYYADEGSTTWGCDHTEGMQHAGDMLRALLAEGGRVMDAASCLACEASGWVDVCSGDSECTSDLHVHGCFADVGNCAAPGEHAPQSHEGGEG